MLWLAIKGYDIKAIQKNILEADKWWIGLTLLLGLASHYSRAIRWRMLIQPLGFNPSIRNTFMAVLIGYFANLAFPRLGEVTKCGMLKKYEGIPINRLLGTMIVERAVDLLCLLFCLGLLFALEFRLLKGFFMDSVYLPLAEVVAKSQYGLAIAGGVFALLVLVFFLLRPRLRAMGLYIKIRDLAFGILDGIRSIGQMKNKGAFIFHSVLIWSLYFLMSYVGLKAFAGTASLGATVGLAVFVMGSFGMVAPVQGGIGAYHFMAISTLALYNVDGEVSRAYAVAMHGSQTLMLVVLGFISLVLLPILNKPVAKPGPEPAPESN